MRHLQVFFYSLGHLSRAPFSTLQTAAVIGIALALPTSLYVILQNVQQLSRNWDGATQISLFLKRSTSAQKASALVMKLQSLPEIAKVEYISQDQALQEFQRLSGFGDVLKALKENPLPSVLVVSPSLRHSTPEATNRLLARMSSLKGVDLAQLDTQWVKRLYAITEIIRRGMQVLAVLLVLAVILVIGNTIRLAVQNRRDEIVIIKLIGGTNAFIRRPFLYTGFWYGLFGGIFANLLIIASMLALSTPIEHLAGLYHSSYQLDYLDFSIALELTFVSIILGLLGSWIAVGRHLRDIEPT